MAKRPKSSIPIGGEEPLKVEDLLAKNLLLGVRQFWIIIVAIIGACGLIFKVYYDVNIQINKITLGQEEIRKSISRIETNLTSIQTKTNTLNDKVITLEAKLEE